MEAKIILNGLNIDNVKNNADTLDIEGTIAHYNRANLNRERVDSKSFDKFFELYNAKKLRPRLNYEHTDQIIGGVDEIVSFDDCLYMKAHLSKNVAIVRDTIIPLIETGDLTSFSTEGYVDYNDIQEFNDGTYYVKNFMLTGVSIVSRPADWDSKFSIANAINDYINYKQEELKKLQQSSKIIIFI